MADTPSIIRITQAPWLIPPGVEPGLSGEPKLCSLRTNIAIHSSICVALPLNLVHWFGGGCLADVHSSHVAMACVVGCRLPDVADDYTARHLNSAAACADSSASMLDQIANTAWRVSLDYYLGKSHRATLKFPSTLPPGRSEARP
jgi:hypothetical protein